MKRCPQLSLELSLKRCKLFHDRITNLDEDSLSHILSRLPTKDVVRTSILSKDWRYKWTTSYNMIVKDSPVDWRDKDKKFIKFVNRMLFYSLLTSFRFTCGTSYGLSRSQGWISSALKHRLEVLEVQCGDPGVVIPYSLLNSSCLQKLKLILYESTMNVAALNCAPNLTSLYIMGVSIVNENHSTSTTVKFNFPLLETFTLRCRKWLNVKSVELHSPLLTTFDSEPSNCDLVEYDYSVLIRAPRLATFRCGSFFPEKFILDGSSIASANLDCDGDDLINDPELLTNIGIRVRNLLNEFKNLEELHLSTFLAEVSQLGPPLLRHDKLRRLTVPDLISAERLLQLLHAAPLLTLLRINVYDWVDYDYEALESLPSCIVSHLEEVEFRGFVCEKTHYNLLKFLSMNGEKLKKLTMSMTPQEKQNEVKVIVSAFRNVEVVFRVVDDF